VALLVIAVLARVATLMVDPKPDYVTGLTVYQGEMARNILDHGKWFFVNQSALSLMGREMRRQRWHLVDPEDVDFSAVDNDADYKPEILEVPGLSVVLAGLWQATGSQRYSYVRWLQIVLEALMVLLVYWIALCLVQQRPVALAAAALYALWPGALVLAKTPSLDTWAGFFTISVLALYVWARMRPESIVRLVLLGVLVGIGVYFRPFILLLPIAFAVAERNRISRRRALQVALVPAAVAALIMTPWMIRNLMEFDRFIPMRVGIGQALWEGLGETPNNFGAVNNDAATLRFVQAQRRDLEYPSPAFDDFLLRKSLRAIRDHPLHYLELVIRRTLYLLPCVLILFWRRQLPYEGALLVSAAAAVILPYVFIRMEDRFWLPAAYVYLILIAAFVAAAIQRLRSARTDARSVAGAG